LTPEQKADRDSVWERIAQERPEFTRSMDLTNNYHTVREIVLGGSLTWQESNKRFKPYLGARIMDIGANVGIFTAWCAANGARVVAYEPHPQVFSVLTEMLSRSQLQAQVVAVNAAISDHNGKIPFLAHVNPDPMCIWYNGAVEAVAGPWVPDDYKNSVPVPCVRFADAIGDTDWDMVKMDIEGAEFQVLLAASPEALRRIKYLYVEFHPWGTEDAYNRTIEKLTDIFHFTGFFQNNIGRWEVGYCHSR